MHTCNIDRKTSLRKHSPGVKTVHWEQQDPEGHIIFRGLSQHVTPVDRPSDKEAFRVKHMYFPIIMLSNNILIHDVHIDHTQA